MTAATERPTRAWNLAAWVGIAIGFVYAVLVGGAWVGIYVVQLRVLSLALIGLVLGTWLVVAAREREWRPRSRLWFAGVACLAAWTVSTLGSRFQRLSLEYLAWGICLGALYLLLVRLMASPFFRARLLTLIVALAFAIPVFYVLTVLQDWLLWWQLVGRVTVPPLRPASESLLYGNPSAVMTISVLLSATAVARLGWASPIRRAATGTLVGLTAAVVILSGSRSGWLAIALTAVLAGGVWLGGPERRSRARAALAARVRTRGPRIAALALLAGVIVVTAVAVPSVLYRIGSGGEDERATFYAASIRIFETAPIIGTGPGSWVVERIDATAPGEPDLYVPHAHDVYLQTLDEFGVAGAAAGAILLVLLVRLVAVGLRDERLRPYGWASIVSTIYLGAHQLLDSYANMPAVLLVFAAPIALLDATESQRSSGGRPLGTVAARGLAVGATAVVGAAIVGLAWSESVAFTGQQAVDRLNAGHPDQALEPAMLAASADPDITAYHVTLGVAFDQLGQHTAALREFETAAQQDDLPNSWLNVAAEAVAIGDSAKARVALGRATRLGLQQPTVAVGVGLLDLRLGARAEATDALVAALQILPSLASDPAWTTNQDLAAVREDVVAKAIGTADPTTAWSVALEAGRSDAAARAREADSGSDAPLITEAWGVGDATPSQHQLDAYAALVRRATERPLDEFLLVWCTRLASRLGLHADFDRFRQWIVLDSGGLSQSAGQARLVFGRTTGDSAPEIGVNNVYYGHFTYRRPTPWTMTATSLPIISLR